MGFKFYFQYDKMDCGPACLAMISSFYGKNFELHNLSKISFKTKDGVSLLGISEAANKIGFKTEGVKLKIIDLKKESLPCILHWNQNHFVVLYKISKNIFTGKYIYKIADPGYGYISLYEKDFINSWISYENKGVALFLKPTENFYRENLPEKNKISFNHLFEYLNPYKKSILILFLLLFLGTIITLFFPFLNQKLIDDGVSEKNISIIIYILLAQLSFFLGNIIFSVSRNWIMLTIGTKVNIQIISDFIKKILKLPINFFETKLMGDFNQRIQDHERIEEFLTSQSIVTIFSLFTFLVFSGVLFYYDYRILAIYFSFTIISIIWSLYWLKKRKILDYLRFQQKSENQESIYQIINGVSEIKLNNFEDFKRDEWENIQQKLFKINIRILRLEQIQTSGFEFVNQFKNIIVTFLTAFFVIKGSMTLGSMLSVSYIIGQMNSPLNQLIHFFRSLQDAKLSLERLNEVKNHPEEENENHLPLLSTKNIKENFLKKGISLKNVSFQYEGPKSQTILKNINLEIPEGKITAIVGASGSGKTTLMKLLLKFHEPTLGNIYYNELNIKDISPYELRKNCGVVMQDGFIFSDTIERNIVTGEKNIDYTRLNNALKIANIEAFIEKIPLGLKTKIGTSGNGISGGQKQRILIARSIYRNPNYIFFDEATSALDSDNEKIIHNNLQFFFKGKTVVIIAHRLSTVKNADQIIVLKDGEVIEKGTHNELVKNKKDYFHLIKNQLELGV